MDDEDKGTDIIGRAEKVDFPNQSLKNIPAKIDTGAYTSSIWASKIKLKKGVLSYRLFDEGSPYFTDREIITRDFRVALVKNSMGGIQQRYFVKLSIAIKDREFRTTFSLADRHNNAYPVLLGRKALRNRFIVDVLEGDPLKNIKGEFDNFYVSKPQGNKATTPLKIGILSMGGGNYTTRRLVDEARVRGHEAKVINHSKCYVAIEQDKPQVRYRGENLDDFDAIIPRIGVSVTRYGSAIVRQFDMQGFYTTARAIAIERSRNKLRSLQVFSKAGVGIPKTIFSRGTDAIDDLVDQIGLPMVIKVAAGTHGKGVVLAETKNAAKSVIQAFYAENVSILLQEFIKESAGKDIRALVVGGRVVASMERSGSGDDFRSNIHQGGTAVPIKLTKEERQTAVKAAKAMGLSICGVDMMRSKRGPLVLEVNSSPGLSGIESTTGKNVAAKIIEYVEVNALRGPKKDRVGV